jgi:DNA-binding transcriptional regulator LsrR (DeoR family)
LVVEKVVIAENFFVFCIDYVWLCNYNKAMKMNKGECTNVHQSEEGKINFLVSLAKAYYEDSATQQEIAETLGISRSQISRYLNEARELGIVQIHIVSPDDHNSELEEGLKRAFPNLKDAIVVPLSGVNPEAVRNMIGRTASKYLQTHLRSGDKIGIGAGRTARYAVNWLKPTKHDVTVSQIVGSVGYHAQDIDYNELARAAAELLKTRVYFMNAPAVLGKNSGTAQELIEGNSMLKECLRLSKSCNIYLVGIGSVSSNELYVRSRLLSHEDLSDAEAKGAVGNICASFYKIDGSECPTLFDDRVVGINLQDLKTAPLTIGVSGGEDKVLPIIGALRGGYINVLITDQKTANKVLEFIKSNNAV